MEKPILNRIRKSKTIKRMCVALSLVLLIEIILPSTAYALTAGTSQPEFSNFEPVVTTDLVNDFTGDFTYNLPVLNIPGPDGGGYAMSLSYHSGASAEAESSWVGFGWTLNPGAINRQKRGYPDDFKDTPITKYNKTRPNWTQSSTTSFNLELNSKDKEKKNKGEGKAKSEKMFEFKFGKEPATPPSGSDSINYDNLFSFSLTKAVRFNNYSGFSISNSVGAGYKGMASLNMTRSGGENTYGVSINPLGLLGKIKFIEKLSTKIQENFNNSKKSNQQIKMIDKAKASIRKHARLPSTYSARSFNAPAIPYSIAYNTGRSFNFSGSVQLNPVGPFGFQVGLAGNLNTQINIPVTTVMASGYMYQPDFQKFSPMVGKDFYDIQEDNIPIIEGDFQIEKATTFKKHDKRLGIPYNNADLLMATGNGAMGGFRFHHKKIGVNYPSMVTNKQQIRQFGVEFGIGGTLEVGLDIGNGWQKTVTDHWKNKSTDTLEYNDDLPFLQFSNDMGGMLRYSNHDSLQYATISKLMQLKLETFDNQNSIKEDEIGQSSVIEYALFNTAGKLKDTLDYGHRDLEGIEDQVGQISITNKDGSKSHYGLPVYVKEETELSIELGKNHFDDGAHIVYKELEYDNPLQNRTALGQRIGTQYAATYLLTQTTTFDYVDVSNDGASSDDFGGWTKFNYRRLYGGSDWYRFRAPYTGLFYDKARLFDITDQMGSMSSGYKEVYYLDYIETKSHVAFFITNKTDGDLLETLIEDKFGADIPDGALDPYLHGSQLDRLDGYDAAAIVNGKDPAAKSENERGVNQLERLEHIVLFAKSDFKAPITTTYFTYDYSLCQKLPNAADDKGKLTLKKVWTEAGGTIKSKIAPYRFKYKYKDSYPTQITTKYPEILSKTGTDGYYAMLQATDQNPNYDAMILDMWGNYRLNGQERYENGQPWLDQRPQPNHYDPAAWQLKQIILPSGGEIHIQYEEKDYCFVQNKRAMAMVALADDDSQKNGYKSGDGTKSNRYYIDLSSIGLTPSDAPQYADYLKLFFEKEKLYFKVLYAYEGSPNSDLTGDTLALKKMDYFTGYTTVDSVGVDSGGRLYLQLGERKKNGNGQNDKTLPRWICFQKYLTASGNNLHAAPVEWDNSDESIMDIAYGEDILLKSNRNASLKEIGKTQAVSGTFRLYDDWSNSEYGPVKLRNKIKKNVCKELNPALSYFKLPLFKAKRGGGIRVKRLISYDPGIETGDAMVYGSEYLYEDTEGNSSGVATNEPMAGREENALVGFLERNPQKTLNKLLNGRDSKFYEGPIGENLYPAASVAYGRIIIKNIHEGESTTGFSVKEYHTVKDYPSLEVKHSHLSKDNGTYRKLNLSLPLGLLNINQQKAWVTQGYLFKLDDRHGKPKQQATYPGVYDRSFFKAEAFSSFTGYKYSEPGDSIQTLLFNPVDNTFEKGYLSPGVEEDLTMYESSVKDKTWDFSVEIDLNFTAFLGVTLGLGPSIQFDDKLLNQHVTTKIIHQNTYLLSTTTTADGVAQTSHNIAFDKYTGDPVLTLTYDGYQGRQQGIYTANSGAAKHEGRYYNLNIPASWLYEDMSANSSFLPNGKSHQLTASAGSITSYGQNPIDAFLNNSEYKDVISATATVYEKNWLDGQGSHHLSNLDFDVADAQSELNSNYYAMRTYVYRDTVTAANDNIFQIYGGGLMPSVNGFDWNLPNYQNAVIGNWFSASKVLAYSPHGYPLAEEDILGIRSIAKFGYNKQLPVLVAQNADYATSYFIDFEYDQPQIDANIIDNYAHSGEKSYSLSQNPMEAFLVDIPLTSQLKTKGATLKFWLRSILSNDPNHPDYGLQNENPNLKVVANNQFYNCTKIAQTGEWSLYEAKMKNWNGAPIGTLMDVMLDYTFEPNEAVLIDDLRFQPLDAVMNCTVYYKDFKVAAQFDDQHFGVFYEYDMRGNLVRKSIETERGRKILQEQQYNTPEILRYYE